MTERRSRRIDDSLTVIDFSGRETISAFDSPDGLGLLPGVTGLCHAIIAGPLEKGRNTLIEEDIPLGAVTLTEGVPVTIKGQYEPNYLRLGLLSSDAQRERLFSSVRLSRFGSLQRADLFDREVGWDFLDRYPHLRESLDIDNLSRLRTIEIVTKYNPDMRNIVTF